MTIKQFEDIIAWQKARLLSIQIDEVIANNKWGNDFALINQIQRAAGSVMDNFAEGFGRMGNGEFIHFLTISNGSAREVQSQLYRALDKKYILQDEFSRLYKLAEEICKIITSLSAYLRKSSIKGIKFDKLKT
jgi:four helix bundle protein